MNRDIFSIKAPLFIAFYLIPFVYIFSINKLQIIIFLKFSIAYNNNKNDNKTSYWVGTDSPESTKVY